MSTEELHEDPANIVQEELDIVHGDHDPKNNLEHQIFLAGQLYERKMKQLGGSFDIDAFVSTESGRNEVMENWILSGDSKWYRKILENHDFKTHPRLQGEYKSITLDDIDFVKFSPGGILPEA